MIVNLINKQRMFSSKLPEKVNGQYWIKDIDENGRSRELIGIEADAGKWIIKSNQLAWLVNENDERQETVTLKENNFLNLQIRGCEEKVILVTHPVEERRQTFEKYVVRDGSVLEIGRAAQNQIIHDNKYT